MKKLLFITILASVNVSFGQFNHDIQLPQNKKFKKLDYWSIHDSLNLNQTGKVQFEWAEFHVSVSEMNNMDSYMCTVDNVSDILNKFGYPSTDITVSANVKKFRGLSGFYYCVVIPSTISKNEGRKDPVLYIIYPRTDVIKF